MKKRLLRIILALAFCLTLLPATTLAESSVECTHEGGEIIWKQTLTTHQQVWSCCGLACSETDDHYYDGPNGVCRVCDYVCPHPDISEATCTSKKKCIWCGMALGGSDPTKHPDFDLYYKPIDADTHQLTWECCGQPNDYPDAHQWNNGVCALCYYSCLHSWSDGTCRHCGVECSHEEETTPAKAPTCTETGLTAGTHCSVCGAVLAAQTEIPAKGHTFSGNTCTVCGYTRPYMDSVSGGSSGGSITVTVAGLADSTTATVIVAQYSGAQLVEVRTDSITGSGQCTLTGFSEDSGETYKVFLLGSASAPLCEAKSPTLE